MLNVLAWLEIHRRQLFLGAFGCVVLIAAVFLWRHFNAEKEAKANAALLSLRARPGEEGSEPKAADYLKVAEQYPSSTAAPRARLLAAGAHFAEGRYGEAQAEFEKVLASEGSGPLAAQAAYGVAASLDGAGKADQALTSYQDVITRFPEESVALQARLSLAGLQQGRGQAAAALRLYDEILRDRDGGSLIQQATQDRESLLKRHPELKAGAAAGTNAPALTPQ